MIEIKNGTLEISEPMGCNYTETCDKFFMTDRENTNITIGLDIILFAITIISHYEKTKTLKSLLKTLDTKVKQVEEVKKKGTHV